MLQHIVPQHYLKGFCDPQPSRRQGQVLWEFRLKGDDVVRQRSPKNVGRIRDYYSVPKNGVMDPAVEGGLSVIESGAAPVIAKLRAGDFAITEEERQWLAAFIALQMVRGPAFRDHVQATMAALAMNILRAFGRRPEAFGRMFREVPEIKDEDKTPSKIEELARMAAEPEKHFKIVATPQASLHVMTIMPDLLPGIRTLRWEFLVAGGQEHLVTSDAPVTLRNAKAPPGFGAGLAVPGTELTLPIGPRVCLRATRGRDHRPDPGHVVTANDDAVLDLNRERARQAQLFIAGDDRATVEWAARRYKEMLARGEAHARPYKTLLIDETGERDEVLDVSVKESGQ